MPKVLVIILFFLLGVAACSSDSATQPIEGAQPLGSGEGATSLFVDDSAEVIELAQADNTDELEEALLLISDVMDDLRVEVDALRAENAALANSVADIEDCLLYTSPSPRD